MLLTRISLDCGYPAAALRERIYALSDVGMYGILLHTRTSGSEGTLGGLVESGRRIGEHLLAAIEEARLCSNDPVCAEHDASAEHDPMHLLAARDKLDGRARSGPGPYRPLRERLAD
jgi:hypothetical protein